MVMVNFPEKRLFLSVSHQFQGQHLELRTVFSSGIFQLTDYSSSGGSKKISVAFIV